MRRILFPLLVIGLAAGLFTLGSGAYFSDTESNTGNTITAGTIDLTITEAAAHCVFADMAPGGAEVTCTTTLNNPGSLGGAVDIEFDVVDSEPTADTDAEAEAEGSALGAYIAKFYEVTGLTFDAVSALGSVSQVAGCHGGSIPAVVNLCDLDAAGVLSGVGSISAATSGKLLVLKVKLHADAGNQHQGDQSTITIGAGLRQSVAAATDPITSEDTTY